MHTEIACEQGLWMCTAFKKPRRALPGWEQDCDGAWSSTWEWVHGSALLGTAAAAIRTAATQENEGRAVTALSSSGARPFLCETGLPLWVEPWLSCIPLVGHFCLAGDRLWLTRSEGNLCLVLLSTWMIRGTQHPLKLCLLEERDHCGGFILVHCFQRKAQTYSGAKSCSFIRAAQKIWYFEVLWNAGFWQKNTKVCGRFQKTWIPFFDYL